MKLNEYQMNLPFFFIKILTTIKDSEHIITTQDMKSITRVSTK